MQAHLTRLNSSRNNAEQLVDVFLLNRFPLSQYNMQLSKINNCGSGIKHWKCRSEYHEQGLIAIQLLMRVSNHLFVLLGMHALILWLIYYKEASSLCKHQP